MKEDHVLAEMRALREEYAASFAHDPDTIFQDLQRVRAEHPGQVVRLPPERRPAMPGETPPLDRTATVE
jgi:hypothetical protein